MPTRSNARIVKRARKLIENPYDWTQAAFIDAAPNRSSARIEFDKILRWKANKTGENCLCVRAAVFSSLVKEDLRMAGRLYFGDSPDEQSVSADICRFGMENGFIKPRNMNGFIKPRNMNSEDSEFAHILAQWQDMPSRQHSDVLALMDAYVAAAPR